MQETLTLKFSGDRLQSGMDAEDVGIAIEGFATLSQIAGRAIYGEDPPLSFKLQEVRPGSLIIKFFMEFAGAAQSLSAIVPAGLSSVGDLLTFIKTCIDLLKHLAGKPPSDVQKVENGNAVQIRNSTGEITIVNGNVYNIFNNFDLGRSVEKIAQPLRNEADELEIQVGGKTAANANKNDVASFRSVRQLDGTLENVSEVFLKVRSPVLEGSGVWRFGFGRGTITAPIADRRFLAQVQSGKEAFRAGDVLRVKLRSTQQQIGSTIKVQYVVEEVIAHQPAPGEQTRLIER